MDPQTLEDKIRQSGNVTTMLRNAQQGPYALPLAVEHSNWRDEQEAWFKTAVLFDQSFHMTDIYFEGPDLRRLLSDVAVNSFATFAANKAKQFVACNYDGYVIGDGILFGHTEDKVSLVGRPAAPNWLAYQAEAGGYDVEVTRDERSVANRGGRKVFRYQLQGPNAMAAIASAADGAAPEVKPFTLVDFTIGKHPVRGLGHTMTRYPGMEITGPWEHADEVKHILLERGGEFGMVEGGARSYPTTAYESGWIASPMPAIYSGEAMRPYREYLRADSWEASASLGGSFVSENIEDYYLTPWDLGYGKIVNFDHHFIGRDALKNLATQSHRKKVWLVWNKDDTRDVIARSLFGGDQRTKYLDLPFAVYATLPFEKVLMGSALVGLAAYTGYTVNLGHVVSLGMVNESVADDGAEAVLVWGEENGGTAKPTVERHQQAEVRVVVRTEPPLEHV